MAASDFDSDFSYWFQFDADTLEAVQSIGLYNFLLTGEFPQSRRWWLRA
jgi:hypothetical protein